MSEVELDPVILAQIEEQDRLAREEIAKQEFPVRVETQEEYAARVAAARSASIFDDQGVQPLYVGYREFREVEAAAVEAVPAEETAEPIEDPEPVVEEAPAEEAPAEEPTEEPSSDDEPAEVEEDAKVENTTEEKPKAKRGSSK